MKSILPKKFYERDPKDVAIDLLGKILVRETKEGIMKGKIVETEAYYGKNDPASHAFKGKTSRSKIMWEGGGKAYVYFTYGMHFLLNVVTGKKGKPSAVLIRALEPLEGIEIMKKNRKISKIKNLRNLTNGPGKLTQAFGITKKQNGIDMTKKQNGLYITMPTKSKIQRLSIVSTSRIGISTGKEKKLRFYIKGNKFVSYLLLLSFFCNLGGI